MRILNSDNIERHGFIVVKGLKDELNKVQSTYVKRLNQDIDYCKIQFLSSTYLDIKQKTLDSEIQMNCQVPNFTKLR